MDVYICSCCGGLLIFRVYRGNRHHPLHLLSGWPCWRMVQSGACGPPEPLPFPVESHTAGATQQDAIDRAVELYRAFRSTDRMEAILGFFQSLLQAGRVRAVRDAIEEILYRFPKSPERDSLLRQVTVSEEWRRLAEQAREQGP